MNPIKQDATAEPASREPLEIEFLVPPDKRVTIAGHHEFREGLRGCTDDDIDFDDVIQIDPYAGDPPSKRSDKEISRLLDVLDSIENDSSGKGKN
jgi:hypothetical protein